MKILRKWTAKRAGGRITINAIDDQGAEIKVVGVDIIGATADGVVAKDKNGTEYRLAA